MNRPATQNGPAAPSPATPAAYRTAAPPAAPAAASTLAPRAHRGGPGGAPAVAASGRLGRAAAAVLLALAAAAGAVLGGRAGRGAAPVSAQAPAGSGMRSGEAGELVVLPVLAAEVNSVDVTLACSASVTVQSLGARPARGIVVVWDIVSVPCQGPARVVCTGLLAPAASWTLGPSDLGATVRPGTAVSAVVVGWAEDDACAALSAALVGSCDAWPAFLRAYAAGEPFAGIPTAGAAAPMAATVERHCDGAPSPAPGVSAYAGDAWDAATLVEPPSGMELALPVLTRGIPGVDDAAWVQNAGAAAVTVVPRVKFQDDAVRFVDCAPIALAPGESARFDLRYCAVDRSGTYAAWLTADGPIAAVVERRQGAGRAAWNAAPLPTAAGQGATTLYAPVVRSEYQGWDTVVYAFNADAATTARVKATFLDAGGQVVTTLTDYVPPHGVQTFFLPVVQTLDGAGTGSARVESLPPPDTAAPPPALVGAMAATRWAETSRHTVLAAVGDALLPADRGFMWPDGVGAGGTASGIGLIAVPELERLAGDARVEASTVVLANLVGAPGFTDVALFLHDANGLLDVTCMRLGERQVARVDLGSLGLLGTAFRGSAVISATWWSHDVRDAAGAWQRNALGLAAAVERRDGAVADAGGDALALVGAVPLAAADGARFGIPLENPCPVPTPGTPRPTPQPSVSSVPPPRDTPTAEPTSGPTPTPDPDPARRRGATVWLPRLAGDEAGCAPGFHVQNVGAEPAKAILVAWGEPGACPPQANGPLKVECSGLIRPGNTWTFGGPQVPTGARSGLVVGVTARRLRELGVTEVEDDVAADYLCESLFFGIVGDADDFLRFRAALETGEPFAALPMDRALVGPLVVTTESRCQRNADDPASIPLVDAAPGIPGGRVGRPDGDSGLWRYDLPLLHDLPAADPSWPPSEVWLQNTGLECATVVVRWRGHADCGVPQSRTLDIAPGESGRFVPTLGPAAWGGGWVESTQPLAVQVLVDYATGRAVYGAPAAAAGLAEEDLVAYAPLVYNGYRRWTTRLHLQNRSATTEARVRIELFDRSGGVLTTLVHALCPGGTDAIALDGLSDLRSNWVGSVRLTSTRWFSSGDPAAEVPEIAGVVELVRGGPVAGDMADLSEATVYPLLAASAGLVHPADGEPWLVPVPRSGAKVLALGSMLKAGGRETVTSQLAIANLVTRPGFTDFVIYIYDQNGLLDYICQKLSSKQVEYIDLRTWGYVQPGFKGAALVSALSWEHPVRDGGGAVTANLVGLGAVILRTPTEMTDANLVTTDLDGPGDLSSAWLGIPLGLGAERGESILPPAIVLPPLCGGGPPVERVTPTAGPPPADRIFLPGSVNQAPIVPEPLDETPTIQPSTPTPTNEEPLETSTPRPTNTPAPTPTPIAFEDLAPSVVHLPALHHQGERDTCVAAILVQSLGAEPSKAALVVWGEPGACPPQAAGPLKVECSGLIKPGGTWRFEGAALPSGAHSAAVYSFNVRLLSQLPAPGAIPPDDVVADYLCELLFFGAVGDADDFRRFDRAYRSGAEHALVPLARAYGAPLAVDVHRRCVDAVVEGAVHHAASYGGVDLPALGGDLDGRWRYGLGPLDADGAGRHAIVHLQNAGADCASVTLTGTAPGTCAPIELASILALAPGEAAIVDVGALGLAGGVGGGWAEASQPLAVVVDTAADQASGAMRTTRGSTAHRSPAGAPGGDTRWYGPLAYGADHGWETVVAVQNLDLAQAAKVAVLFVDGRGTVIARHVDWICAGGGRRFVLPLAGTGSGHRVGSAHALSQEVDAGGSIQPPRPIAASVEGYRYARPADPASLEAAFAYDMVPAARAEGVGRLAFPMMSKRGDAGVPGVETSTELTIANVVADPGSTDVALYFFDQTGLIDYVCMALGPGMTESIDLASWGFVNPGFVGSGLVSAVHWTHQNGARMGLAGAMALREGADVGQDAPGDDLAAVSAWPLTAPLPMDLGLPTCPHLGGPLATVTPAAAGGRP